MSLIFHKNRTHVIATNIVFNNNKSNSGIEPMSLECEDIRYQVRQQNSLLKFKISFFKLTELLTYDLTPLNILFLQRVS